MSEFEEIRDILADFGLFLTRVDMTQNEDLVTSFGHDSMVVAGQTDYQFSGNCNITIFRECSQSSNVQLYKTLRSIDLNDPAVKDQFEKLLTVAKLKE